MSTGQKPKYWTCQHYIHAPEASMTLQFCRLRHRLYGSRQPKIVTQKEEDRAMAVVHFPEAPKEGDWLVCLASHKKGGNIRTWPEWTWGKTRYEIPTWFRGEDFRGETSSDKRSWLISSCDVEDYVEKLKQDKPSEIVVESHHEEKNRWNRMVWYLTFSWNGSIQDLRPSGWLTPLTAAAKRLEIPVVQGERNKGSE